MLFVFIFNGFVVGFGNLEGLSYKFFCWDGYFLVGLNIVYCIFVGGWNVSVFRCFWGKNKIVYFMK